MNKLKIIVKGLLNSIKYRTLNPLYFNLEMIKDLAMVSDDYLIVKLKHETHLLEKNIKNNYEEGRGGEREKYVRKLISELSKRNMNEKEIEDWSRRVLLDYDLWKKDECSQVQLGDANPVFDVGTLSVPSIRFWKKKIPDRSIIDKCIGVAKLAPASCNRQGFKVIVVENTDQKTDGASALNSSMFNAAAYRVFIYYNRNNYTEKYSAAIDVGLFTQNFILEAKSHGLGCCCCYASEHLELPQSYYRKKFDLPPEYYCLLTILVGYPNEIVNKPPRVSNKNIVRFVKD